MLRIWQNLDSMRENPITIVVFGGKNILLLIIAIERDVFFRTFLVLIEST
jgi:hypothetical protein